MGVNDFPRRQPDSPGPHDSHDGHDELLVVALAGGVQSPADATAAEALVASCPDCARLLDDARLIRAALRDLPTPSRPRDFRLTEEDAARLRRAGWRRFLAPLAGPRFAFAQPLAGALVALGLVGILVGTVPGVLEAPSRILSTVGGSVGFPEASTSQGATNGGPVGRDTAGSAGVPAPALAPAAGFSAAGVAPTAGPSMSAGPSAAAAPYASTAPSVGFAPAAGSPAASGPTGKATGAPSPAGTGTSVTPGGAADIGRSAASGAPEAAAGSVAPTAPGSSFVQMRARLSTEGPPPLLVAALALLAAGAGLFLLRWVARRLA